MSEENTVEELQARLAELEAAAKRAKDDAAAKGRQLKKFEGVDLESLQAAEQKLKDLGDISEEGLAEMRALQAKLTDQRERELFEKGGLTALVDAKTAQLRETQELELKAHLTRAEQAEAEREAAIKSLNDREVSVSLSQALAGNEKILPGMAEFIEFKLKPYVTWEDGQAVLRSPEDGIELVSPGDASKPMSISEWVASVLPKVAPSVLKASQGSGGRGSGDGADLTDNPFLKKSPMAQAKLRKENPELAKKLAAQARAAGKGTMIAISGV